MMARVHAVCERRVEGAIFESLIGTYLPLGGAILSLIEAHFDESIGEKPRNVLCIAGYIMTDRAARRLTREWCTVLRDYDLPYFRMSACAHGNYPFNRLSIDDRITVEKRVIEITRRRTLKGFAVVMDTDEFSQYMPKHPLIGSAYTFCAHVIIGGIAHWVGESKYNGRIAYVFEAGHRSQPEAEAIMRKIFANAELKSGQRYASHAFVDKISSPPTQAADLLSWHTYTEFRRRAEGKPRRKDFAALLRPRVDHAVVVDQAKIIELATKWTRTDESEAVAIARLHLGDRDLTASIGGAGA